MNKLFYPSVFHKAEEGGYWVTFPDFPECVTEGDTTAEAYEMAFDALGLCISDRKKDNEELPIPSALENIKLENDSVLVLIEFDMLAYNKKFNSKSVKKTLSIPEWLNEEATRCGANFSQVLQEALIEKYIS